MYLNFSNVRGTNLGGGGGDKPWSKNGDKCRMGGGIGKIFAGWGDPQSPPEKNPALISTQFIQNFTLLISLFECKLVLFLLHNWNWPLSGIVLNYFGWLLVALGGCKEKINKKSI